MIHRNWAKGFQVSNSKSLKNAINALPLKQKGITYKWVVLERLNILRLEIL